MAAGPAVGQGNEPTTAAQHIIGFRQDEEGHWIAVLDCGHTQHVRHNPPWQSRPWVLTPEGRRARWGTPFPCGWCAQSASEVPA